MKSAATQQLSDLFSRWEPLLSSPVWYLTILPEIEAFNLALENESVETKDVCKALLYDFFEYHLVRGCIALSSKSGDADTDRQSINTVVIHHTSNPPGLSPERLSALELVRLYAPYFAAPKSQRDQHLRGQPIYSGHLRDGKQVFWPYHWIVRRDGTAERLLRDSEIGWHAGDWNVNCRSVAIALDGDYEYSSPSTVELRGIADVIVNHYRHVPVTGIVGHREVNPRTTCPSELFLAESGRRGWKAKLLVQVTCQRKDAPYARAA